MVLCAKSAVYILCVAYLAVEILDIISHPLFFTLLSRLKNDQDSIQKPSDEKVCNPIPDFGREMCPEIHPGMVIAAGCSLRGSVLSGNIILIVAYTHVSGAFGLVLNGHRIPVGSTGTVVYGGPQATDKRYQLHSDASLMYSRKVADKLFFGGDMRITPTGDVAVFYGSNYWAPDALEQEMEHGDWRLLGEASADSILENSKTT